MKEKSNKVIKIIVLIIIVVITIAGVSINWVMYNNGTIHKNKGASEKQETVTNVKIETITATDIEKDASYIGKYVNYGGEKTYKGVKWRIFNAENGQIQLIADNYIKSDVMPIATNILNGKTYYGGESDYIVFSLNNNQRKLLLNYINTSDNWSNFVAVSGATVTGGPTIEQFINSYNRTHGANSEADVKEIYITQSEVMKDGLNGYYVGTSENPKTHCIDGLNTTEMENLYVLDNTNCSAYWLGSPSVSYSSCLISIAHWGGIDYTVCSQNSNGLRPLVILPSGITLLEQENGTYNIQKENLKEKDTITATNIEADANYIGKYVNYGGEEIFKGVKWRIFNAENGQVQLIADNYIDANVMPTAQNILKGPTFWSKSNYEVVVDVEEGDRTTLLNYINTTSNWSNFVAVSGATVTGGPTIEQFINSYNRTHKVSDEADAKEIHIAQSEAMEDGLKGYYIGTSENPQTYWIDELNSDLYIIANPILVGGYWLGSASANSSCVISVSYQGSGSVGQTAYNQLHMGLRPLVTLPTGITLVEQENGTYNIQIL